MKVKIFSIIVLLITIIFFRFYNHSILVNEEAVGENIAIVIDGEKVDSFPTLRDEVVFDKVLCKNGSSGSWDNSTWSLKMNFINDDSCIVYFKEVYKESLLFDSTPLINSGFIPVVIDNDGIVRKADIFSKWYSYEDKEWVNAVTVNSESLRDADAGTIIPMDNIEEMYVWIPRYAYDADTIVDADHAIDITFVDIESDAHPAFTVDGVELRGTWVGKFEMGLKVGENESTANVEYVIKPNLNSVHNTNGYNLFSRIANINNTNKLDNTTDVHMMKNTEWGSVAYLSQSLYGVCSGVSDCKKVENNNYYNSSTNDIVTGCGGDDAPQESRTVGITICPESNRWTTELGMHASTTRNITGIYDMAGGRNEYVMGNMLNSSGLFYSCSSGFSKAPETKYYDIYINGGNPYDYSRGLIGDATMELVPSGSVNVNWNDDFAYFVSAASSWVKRGGYASNGSSAGIWNFYFSNGNAYADNGARAAVWAY